MRQFFVLLLLLPMLGMSGEPIEIAEAMQSPYVYHSVNVITGGYVEAEVDLESIPLKRYYTSQDVEGQGWYFNLPNLMESLRDDPPQSEGDFSYFYDDQNRLIALKSGEHSYEIDYPSDLECRLTSETGEKIDYRFEKVEGARSASKLVLSEVVRSDGTYRRYRYRKHPFLRQKVLSARELPDGRYSEIEYDGSGKVRCIREPAGVDGSAVATQKFVYYPGWTVMFDAAGNKTIYRYDSKVLCAIEQYEGDALYRSEKLYWKEGKLLSKTVEDGEGNILICRSNWYDEKGNVCAHALIGELSGNSCSPIIMGKYGYPIENGVEKHRSYFKYDHQNRIVEEKEEHGKETLFRYDESGRLARKFICDEGKIKIRHFYEYNDEGTLSRTIVDNGRSSDVDDLVGVTERHIRVISPDTIEEYYWDNGHERLLRKTVNEYSSDQLLSKQVYDAEANYRYSILFEYDERGNKVCETDPKGNVLLSVYDANGNEIEVQNGEERLVRVYDFSNRMIRENDVEYRYDSSSNRVASIDAQGNETHYFYDLFGRLISTRQPEVLNGEDVCVQPEFRYEYDPMDRITTTVNPNGLATKTRYNARGKPIELRHPDGSTERFEYFLDGALKRVVAKDGTQILYTRDFLSRVTREQHLDALGNCHFAKEFEYDSFHLIRKIDLDGTVSYRYDKAGRVIAETCGDRRIENAYNALGSLCCKKSWYEKDADAFASLYLERDPLEEVQNMRLENSEGTILKEHSVLKKEDLPIHEEEIFNSLGQRVLRKWVVDRRGYQTIQNLDALGRIESIEYFDPLHQLLSKQEFRYDPAGNRVRQTDFTIEEGRIVQSSIIAWEYDCCGRVIKEINGPRESVYRYDVGGRILETIKPDGVHLFYAYDEMGRLERLHSSDLTVDYAYRYDPQGKIREVYDAVYDTTTVRNGHYEKLGNGLEVHYQRDLLQRPTEMTLPDQSKIRWTYDAAYLREVARESASGETLYAYRYSLYNTQGVLQTAQMIGGLGEIRYAADAIETPYWKESQQLDEAGNVTERITEDFFGRSVKKFCYSGLNQLVSDDHAYTYDSLHNRLTEDATRYTYDEQHRLLECGGDSFHYDANGNRTGRNGIEYRYDALDRLISVKKEGVETRYTYDAFHRRITKTEGAALYRYLYDGDREIGMVNEQGEITELRVLGEGIGAEIGAAVAIEMDGEVFAPIHDQSGSLRCLVDLRGNLAACYRYNAFGKPLEEEGISSPWKFSSKRCDSETGLIYYGKRYYDPSVGRWLTRDPLGTMDGANPYAFVGNNPLSQFDLYGLFSVANGWNALTSFLGDTVFWMRNNLSLEDYLYDDYRLVCETVFGSKWLRLAGFYQDKADEGIYGKGEVHDQVRITMINGILNARCDYKDSLRLLSDAHGGCNVHFIFYPTGGWTRDILKCLVSKVGFVSPEAKRLAKIWKELIAEMGGVDGGGKIIHYAHSIGGTDTSIAKNLLTEEEQKMIQVITIGSATMIKNEGFQSVKNYVSVRDGVCLLDPLGYLRAIFDPNSNTTFVGSLKGIPLVEHTLNSGTYEQVILFLGLQFIQLYVL